MSINWKKAIAIQGNKGTEKTKKINPCARCGNENVIFFTSHDCDYDEYSHHAKCECCKRSGPSVTCSYSEHHSDYLQPSFNATNWTMQKYLITEAWNLVNPPLS